ncbi:MAG: hypothetical protein M9894_22805 [Planctomycetes bacterium]|nr:hypothetical protein [Planctomycetota bacterium]
MLAFDSALLRLAVRARREEARRLRRLLEAARALAPRTAAARALVVVDRWAAWRHGARDPAAPPLAGRLDGRYTPQEVTRQALDVLEGDLRAGLGELEARLTAWSRAWAGGQALGLVDAGGQLAREVSYEAAMRLELLLAALERRVWLLVRRAYLLRGGAGEGPAWDEALAAARALDDYRGEDPEPLVVIHAARGDPAQARAALRRVAREPRRAELELEVVLLEGDLPRARALLPALGEGQAARGLRALVGALGGEDVSEPLAALRREAPEAAWIPWRGPDAAAHAVAAARRGWRPWVAGRPWP